MTKICQITECDRKVLARGYCGKHYQRFMKYGDARMAVYFRGDEESNVWRRAEKADNGCWNWTRRIVGAGYGRLCFRGQQTLAHRAAWMLTHGDIPDGLHVLHKCDNPACINPDHLYLGTHQQNMRDKVERGRQPRKLTKRDVWFIRACNVLKGTELARMFGVAPTTITAIKKRREWAHV